MTKVTKKAEKVITNKFVAAVLKDLNKTEKDKKIESVEDFVAKAQIECETQIGLLTTSELPKLRLEEKKINNELNTAKKAFETARFSVARDFAEYVANRENAQDNIDDAEHELAVPLPRGVHDGRQAAHVRSSGLDGRGHDEEPR